MQVYLEFLFSNVKYNSLILFQFLQNRMSFVRSILREQVWSNESKE